MKTRTSQLIHLAIIVAFTLLLPALPMAHAKLEKTEPADGATIAAVPPSVQMWFDEKLDAKVSKIELTGPAGKVAVGQTHAMGDKVLMADITGKMVDGAYTVDYQTAGDDGHVQKGKFGFTLKRTTH
jgi:methionine-rich copper-binding protein CopC